MSLFRSHTFSEVLTKTQQQLPQTSPLLKVMSRLPVEPLVQPGMTYEPSTWEVEEARGSEFKASQGYTGSPFLTTVKRNHTTHNNPSKRKKETKADKTKQQQRFKRARCGDTAKILALKRLSQEQGFKAKLVLNSKTVSQRQENKTKSKLKVNNKICINKARGGDLAL